MAGAIEAPGSFETTLASHSWRSVWRRGLSPVINLSLPWRSCVWLRPERASSYR